MRALSMLKSELLLPGKFNGSKIRSSNDYNRDAKSPACPMVQGPPQPQHPINEPAPNLQARAERQPPPRRHFALQRPGGAGNGVKE
jgi:hypothetical protein